MIDFTISPCSMCFLNIPVRVIEWGGGGVKELTMTPLNLVDG